MGFYIRLDQGYGNPFPEAKVIGVWTRLLKWLRWLPAHALRDGDIFRDVGRSLPAFLQTLDGPTNYCQIHIAY
jgi:diadenosine tetraphosphatase ApaH/serine/threonine PP2A family protein phosphatase